MTFPANRFRCALAALSTLASGLVAAQTLGPVTTTVLRDFEDNTVGGLVAATTVNSAATAASGCTFTNVIDAGSKRVRMNDTTPGTNGGVVTITGAIPGPGNWLITADVKVVNTDNTGTNVIDSFGMAAKLGGTATAKIGDANAGYVMNLPDNAANSTALGYQTIAARVEAPTAGSYPQDVTLYFSTDPSRSNDSSLPANDGNFNGQHRAGGNNWQSVNNHVLLDNIKRIGPGRLTEDRHMWISIGDAALTNQATMESYLVAAKANNFTAVDILARYRANRFYVRNRDFSTYPSSEPGYSGTNFPVYDPMQYAIDRGRELGLKVYASFACFLVTDGSNTYPGFLNSNYRTSVYNGGTPAVQTTANGDPEGLWVDPGYSATRDYTRGIAMDLAQNYDLDGIIFDRIRYSDSSHGYNPLALSEAGIAGVPTTGNAAFSEARRNGVTEFLSESYTSITTLKPWMVVGTVPIAYGNDLSSTYNGVFQAWYKWNSAVAGNRTVTFGAQDLTQPQYYRQWDTASPNTGPGANETLMGLAQFGDVSAFTRDYGASPGALTNVAPLLWWSSFSDATDANNTAATIAANACDSRDPLSLGASLQGWGTFSAGEAFDTQFSGTGVARLRAASTPCGTDVLAAASEGADFLMKAGYDRTPPTTVTVFNAVGGLRRADLTWNTPSPAADGETPTRYLIYRNASPNVRQFRANLVSPTAVITGNSYSDVGVASGTWYYRIVPVDDYNNWGPAKEIGPVTVNGVTVIVETRTSGGTNTGATTMTLSGSFTQTTSKSTAPGLVGSGSLFSTTAGTSVTLRPNLPVGGLYDVSITLDDAAGGPNNNAVASWGTINYGSPFNGSVTLVGSDVTLANTWKTLATGVPMTAGQSGGIVLVGTTVTNRFCVDAVKFELSSFSAAPLPAAVSGFTLE